jgi:2-polyprenyl-3-methyl-5-hydroxy-6-metoxy-1,4-benzoquinol methylase
MAEWMRVPTDYKRVKPVAGRLYWCGTCEVGALLPAPSEEEVAESYRIDHYYTHGASHFVQPMPDSWTDRLRLSIAWRLDRGQPLLAPRVHELLDGKPSRIIDIGCGSGHLIAGLASLGHSVVGVEMDSRSMARQEMAALEVYRGTAEKLPAEVEAGGFDCVILSHVLEHCRQPVLALRNLRGLLKPGGLLLCEVPNNAALGLEMMGASWEMLDVPRHLQFFTVRSLAALMESAGLEVKSTWFAHFSRQFTNEWIETEQTLWRNLMVGKPWPDPAPRRNSRLRAWALLARCLVAGPGRRYDCIGIAARNRGD